MHAVVEFERALGKLTDLEDPFWIASKTTPVHPFILQEKLGDRKLVDNLFAQLTVDWYPICACFFDYLIFFELLDLKSPLI